MQRNLSPDKFIFFVGEKQIMPKFSNVILVFAGIIDFDVDDVYDVVLIDRLLHIL